MNREILFRGKRVGNEEWVYGQYVARKNDVLQAIIITRFVDSGNFDYYSVDPATVGQFTGLLDKNGDKVFEGDILKGKYVWNGELTRIIGVVTYESREYTLHGVKQYEGLIKPFDRAFEVIGNIHDNPELIK